MNAETIEAIVRATIEQMTKVEVKDESEKKEAFQKKIWDKLNKARMKAFLKHQTK